MKPALFDYERPATIVEALRLIERPGAKLLAGGQSLIPLLNLRLARPSLLVDIGRLPGLDEVAVDDQGQLHIGALVKHQRLALNATVLQSARLLVYAVEHVGHVAIRNRGTLGGSLAHADPTAELCTAMVSLGARFRVLSTTSERWIDAVEFFRGPFTTTLRDDEMLVEVLVPERPEREGASFLELTQRLGDFAIVSVAALALVDSGRLASLRVTWSGAAERPLLAEGLADTLVGAKLADPKLDRSCRDAVEQVDPNSDFRGSAAYKRAVLAELTARAVRAAARESEARAND